MGIVWIDPPDTVPRSGCTPTANTEWTIPEPQKVNHNPTLGDVVGAFKSLVFKVYLAWVRDNDPTRRAKFWQRNYYEHIIRDERAFQAIRRYIRRNSEHWTRDRDNQQHIFRLPPYRTGEEYVREALSERKGITMRVLKVVAEGITTSFRYPYFMQQIHPSFPMPPPATIYGHICSVLGEWFEPQGVRFAYHFTYAGKVRDVEHIILLSRSRGQLPGSRIPKVLQGKVNPFERELLFRPRLTLYINHPEWVDAFRSPRYAVALGRSQDLFTYTEVDTVELRQERRAYFEHALAPHEMALRTASGLTVLMPRFLDYARNRAPTFERYVVLQERVFSDDFYRFGAQSDDTFWVDPATPEVKGAHRGVIFLSFVEGEVEQSVLA